VEWRKLWWNGVKVEARGAAGGSKYDVRASTEEEDGTTKQAQALF